MAAGENFFAANRQTTDEHFIHIIVFVLIILTLLNKTASKLQYALEVQKELFTFKAKTDSLQTIEHIWPILLPFLLKLGRHYEI